MENREQEVGANRMEYLYAGDNREGVGILMRIIAQSRAYLVVLRSCFIEFLILLLLVFRISPVFRIIFVF